MKNGVSFVLGVLVGAAAGVGGTYFWMKKREKVICENYDEAIAEIICKKEKPLEELPKETPVEVPLEIEEEPAPKKPKARTKKITEVPKPEEEPSFKGVPTPSLRGLDVKDSDDTPKIIRGTEKFENPDIDDPDPEYVNEYASKEARPLTQMFEFGQEKDYSFETWHMFTDGIISNDEGEIMDETECIDWMGEDYLNHFNEFDYDNAAYFVTDAHRAYVELDKEDVEYHVWYQQRYPNGRRPDYDTISHNLNHG